MYTFPFLNNSSVLSPPLPPQRALRPGHQPDEPGLRRLAGGGRQPRALGGKVVQFIDHFFFFLIFVLLLMASFH